MTGSLTRDVDVLTKRNIELAKIAFSRMDVPSGERRREHYQPLFDILADDVMWYVTAPNDLPVYGGEVRGKEAIMEIFLAEMKEHSVIEMGPREYFGTSECVVIRGTVSYMINKSGFFIKDRPFVDVFDFREGLITRILSIEDCREYDYAYRGLGPTGGVL